MLPPLYSPFSSIVTPYTYPQTPSGGYRHPPALPQRQPPGRCGTVLPAPMRSRSAPVPSNRSSQQKKQKAASLLQLTACFYVWSERLDSNQRPPAPKAGALPCCATLRDGMFCTQKALLWQGRPVWRPRALPALREKPPPAGQDRGALSLARQMTTADRAPSINKDEREHAGRTWPFPPRRKRTSRRPFPANEAYPLPCTRE